jgi:hypothetical protein
MIIPFLVIDGFTISNLVEGDINATNIVFCGIATFVVLYVVSLTVFGINNISVYDDFIKYNYYFFERNVLFSDIIEVQVEKYFYRHQLVIKSKSLLKHRIWLDSLNADIDTILEDIKKRISKYNLTIYINY